MENAEFWIEDAELLHEVVYKKYPGRWIGGVVTWLENITLYLWNYSRHRDTWTWIHQSEYFFVTDSCGCEESDPSQFRSARVVTLVVYHVQSPIRPWNSKLIICLFALLVWLMLMWWKNLCKCVPLYEKVAQRGGTVRRGIGVGDVNLPAHFSRRPAAATMVLVWNRYVF